jgi:hypothetical protein
MLREKRQADRLTGRVARSRLFCSLKLVVVLLLTGYLQNEIVYGQASRPEVVSQQHAGNAHDGSWNQCSEAVSPESGNYKFRWQGESFEIPLIGPCQAVALELRWSNGRNNGSNFHVTFLDGDNQPIYTKELSGFLTGNFSLSFTKIEPSSGRGSASMMSVASVPAKVVIEAVRPFAFPANISYTIIRATVQPRQPQGAVKGESEAADKGKSQRLKEEITDSADCMSGKAPKQTKGY